MLLLKTHDHLEEIKRVVNTCKCEVIYRLFVYINNNEFPALMFDEQILCQFRLLNAKLDIVIIED